MKTASILLLALVAVFIASAAHAQAPTTIAVDIDRAVLQWTPPIGGSPATGRHIKCGPSSGVYPSVATVADTATSAPIKSVVPEPGTYFCVTARFNAFGESPPSPEVNFSAGRPPDADTGLVIQFPAQ